MTEPTPSRHSAVPPEDETDPRGLLYLGDVRALRRADTVTFDHHDGDATIDAALTTWPYPPPRIYTAAQQRLFPDVDSDADLGGRHRRIAVAGTICGVDAAGRWRDRYLPDADAVHTLHHAALHERWRSVAALLRVGDVLGTCWRNAVVEGLHRHELSLVIDRGRHHYTFLLDVVVTADPSMIIGRSSS